MYGYRVGSPLSENLNTNLTYESVEIPSKIEKSSKNLVCSVSDEKATTETSESPITTTTASPDVITAPPNIYTVDLSSNMRMDHRNRTLGNEEAVKRAQPLDLDDLLANSTHLDEDYDAYDYSEPRLPPSLPNLV